MQDAAGQPVWQTQTPAFEVRDWPIDLRGQACGRYQLVVAGRSVGDFYLSDEPAVRRWGVVEISLKTSTRRPRSPSRSPAVKRCGATTSSTSRSPGLYAGYEVVGVQKRSGGPDRSSSRDIRFTRRTETVTVNGRPAFVFESRQTVPLAEVPTEDHYLFTFRANGGSERGGRPVKLPFAQPSATKLDATPDGARMFSEIFVYL